MTDILLFASSIFASHSIRTILLILASGIAGREPIFPDLFGSHNRAQVCTTITSPGLAAITAFPFGFSTAYEIII
jgi:hypothetical protein